MRVPPQVFRLAKGKAHLLLVSADAAGAPHLAAAGGLSCLRSGRVGVRYWFCPQTLANLEANPRCSLVVWDAASDRGFQLTGEVDGVRQGAMLDGYLPDQTPLPQAEYEITIRVQRVLEFRHAPHTDAPIAAFDAARA
jgi:hypothetical protein